jgi:hypothetical protein
MMSHRESIKDALLNQMGYTDAQFLEEAPIGNGNSEYYFIVNHRAYGRYEVKAVPSSEGHYDIYRESDEVDSFQGEIVPENFRINNKLL